jgi:hypothetical protein
MGAEEVNRGDEVSYRRIGQEDAIEKVEHVMPVIGQQKRMDYSEQRQCFQLQRNLVKGGCSSHEQGNVNDTYVYFQTARLMKASAKMDVAARLHRQLVYT